MNKLLLINIVDMVQVFTLAQNRQDEVRQTYIFQNGTSIRVSSDTHGFLTSTLIDANGNYGHAESWQRPLDVAERMVVLAE